MCIMMEGAWVSLHSTNLPAAIIPVDLPSDAKLRFKSPTIFPFVIQAETHSGPSDAIILVGSPSEMSLLKLTR